MKIKCDYCGAFIEDTDEKCEFCGAVNSHLVRSATGIPKTIEELKAFAKDKNLPLQDMRFFLGEDYKGPKAFGIYYDPSSENYVVYKNKSDGTRAVRYEGKDESYAVNEIYQKMKSEMLNQRAMNVSGSSPSSGSSGSSGSSSSGGSGGGFKKIIFYALMAFFGLCMLTNCGMCGSSSSSGSSNGTNSGGYYSDYGSSDDSSWLDDLFDSNNSSSGSSWDSDWDSDWDWGGSDWDSGGSDWDSDW